MSTNSNRSFFGLQPEQREEALAQLGNQGWELVSVNGELT